MMANQPQDFNEEPENQWKLIYTIGGISTLLFLLVTFFDIIIGSSLGVDITTIPQSATGRFRLFQENLLLGLYYLDLLNLMNQIILIPSFFALYAAHRNVKNAYSTLALIIFLVGTTIFITNNCALPMLELSHKYVLAKTEAEQNLLAAAGEALLAKGAHGSMGAFPGFALSTIASILIAITMLKAKVFSKATGYIGIFASGFMLIYLILVTFVPATKKVALIFAMPGGLLSMAWMIMYMTRLFKLGRLKAN